MPQTVKSPELWTFDIKNSNCSKEVTLYNFFESLTKTLDFTDCDTCDMREVTQGFVTCNRPEDAKPMGNLETASQALLLAALKGKLKIIKIYF